jgi:hypothetical protein
VNHGIHPPTCDGCGEQGVLELLVLGTPLGDTSVQVHRTRECAQLAKDARGGGKYHPERMSHQEKLMHEEEMINRARIAAYNEKERRAREELHDRLRATVLRIGERIKREGR